MIVCTANLCRSVIAEALFELRVKNDPQIRSWAIESAGVDALDNISPSADVQQVCIENGLDVSDHRSRQLTKTMMDRADVVLCMAQQHKDVIVSAYPSLAGKISLLKEFGKEDESASLSVEDPTGRSFDHYRVCYAEIDQEVSRIIPLLMERDHTAL